MTIAARTRLLLLAVLCAALALSLSTAPVTAASTPTATAAKKKRGHKRRATKRDLDGDGIPNSRDRDVDGDGKPNGRDRDVDGDGKPNWRDRDIDGDGKPNVRDRDMDGDGLSNAKDRDMDGDGKLNFRDPDPDADGKPGIAPGVLPSPPPPVKQPRTFFGLVTDDGITKSSTAIAATGAGTVRIVFSWQSVESSPGFFDFTALDREVEVAAEHGLTIMPLLANPPSFRSSAPAVGAARGLYPPTNNADFGTFAAAAARRYGPSGSFWQQHPSLTARPIRAWQVWNEPNLPVYWASGPDPAQYVSMLRAVGGAIKQVDPGAEIVTAGLPDSGLGIPLAEYVAGMYRAGAREVFDTLATHPYATTPEGVVENLTELRKLLNRHGDRDAGLRVTEFGWATSGPPAALNVGEQAQARLIGQTLDRLTGVSARLQLRGVLYFSFRDSDRLPDGRDYWGLHTGLVGHDGHPKLGLQAFTTAAHRLTAP